MGAGTVGVYLTGSGAINIVGNTIGAGNNTQIGYRFDKAGPITYVGNIYGSNNASGQANQISIYNTGSVSITGDIIARLVGALSLIHI